MFTKLREIRKAQGYTCREMAEKLSLTKGTYSKKERGLIMMTLYDAKKIAEILGRTIDDIFFDSFNKTT